MVARVSVRQQAALALALASMGWGPHALAEAEPDIEVDVTLPDSSDVQLLPSPDLLDEDEEGTLRGFEDAGRTDGDTFREVLNGIVWLPRFIIDWTFRGTEAAANIVAEEQLVPRYRRLLGIPKDGEFFVFPTAFAETGSALDVGLRMISNTRYVTTTQRFGYGGPRDVVVESRAIFDFKLGIPFAVSLEAFGQSRGELEFHGIGLRPDSDERNAFRDGRQTDVGLYQEQRSRFISSLGMRLTDELEFYLSSSLQRRRVRDARGVDRRAISEVFEPEALKGFTEAAPWLLYSEVAARFDSRSTRARPVPGVFVELYAGGTKNVTSEEPVAFMRTGGRGAVFIPIYRQGNILSPRIAIDRIIRLNSLDVPFNELPRQPDFRGFDRRRDDVSVVASLDYTWLVTKFLAFRVFADGATVAPGISELSYEQIRSMRLAAGVGFDIFSDRSSIARFGVAGSPEGARVLFALGRSWARFPRGALFCVAYCAL
ncbi:MAG: hypothetical protein AAGA56_12470 [Myxococcota bacterium]